MFRDRREGAAESDDDADPEAGVTQSVADADDESMTVFSGDEVFEIVVDDE